MDARYVDREKISQRINNHFSEHEDVRDMEKIGDRMGTNPAGIFRDHRTREVLYVKMYPDWSQSGCEFIANKIYQRLGVPVLEGHLVPFGNGIAYATAYQEDFVKLSVERRKEVQKYFVAAAYLMDFDIVGIGPENPYGNLQIDSNGKLYVVDHGAALLFKGLLGRKEQRWLDDPRILELDTMRDASVNPKSKAVFGDISQEEIQRQIARLVQIITPEVIEEIVAASMLPERDKETVRKLLLRRREALHKREVNTIN